MFLIERPAKGTKSCVYDTENCSLTTELRKASSRLDLNWPPSKASLVDCLVALRYKLHKLHLATGCVDILWTAFSFHDFPDFQNDGTKVMMGLTFEWLDSAHGEALWLTVAHCGLQLIDPCRRKRWQLPAGWSWEATPVTGIWTLPIDIHNRDDADWWRLIRLDF